MKVVVKIREIRVDMRAVGPILLALLYWFH